MGSAISSLYKAFAGSDETKEFANPLFQINFADLDDANKTKLFNFIKSVKTKNLHLPDDFTEKIKDIELESTELIPMCLELYDKLMKMFGEYKPPANPKNQFKKKQFFVKPKFTEDSVKKTIATEVQNISSELIQNLVKIDPAQIPLKVSDITTLELIESFNENITKKDMIGISKKIIREMSNYLKVRFVNVFNQILDDETKAAKHAIGRASYIYKAAKHGPTNDIGSFRQIVSIPNAVNQFHRLLCLRLNNYMQSNKYIDTSIQKGGVAGQRFAIFEQYYKVKNVLKDANKSKKPCAMLFIDISNAFGNLNLENLYKILDIYGVDGGVINYIKSFYSNFEYYVESGDIKTDSFKWKDGLIQGCSLSPLLFIIALNYILKHTDDQYKNACGYTFSDPANTKILLTAFVDDISIICKDVVSVELVYKKISELLKMLGLPVNKAKCALMVVNDNSPLTPELSTIQKVNVFKYLGEYVSSDGSCTESYVQLLRMMSRRLISLDAKKMSEADKLKMFSAYLVPWIQRKTMTMYDITMNNRLKIVSIVKPYVEKWGGDGNVNIFSNVTPILNNSSDAVISMVTFEDENFDTDLEQNIEIANYVLKDANIKIEYSQIDDDFQLDAELAEYDEVTNE